MLKQKAYYSPLFMIYLTCVPLLLSPRERREREKMEAERAERDKQEKERERLERERTRILKETAVDSQAAVDQHFSKSLQRASQRVGVHGWKNWVTRLH